MWKPGQIVTLKPDGIHNKRFRITKVSGYRGVAVRLNGNGYILTCAECKEANMDIRNHNTGISCPFPTICSSCKIPISCYPKPID